MSTLPAADVRPQFASRTRSLPVQQAAGVAAVAAVVGISTIWPVAGALWQLWMMDALKSIGMAVPVVSLVLILRTWRSLHWQMEGTWWGLAILAATIAIVRIREQAVIVFVLSPQWNLYLPPHSLVAFAYGAGVVLLLGGTRLFRAALFPIVLLWFVNPIPHVFNVLIDLPLQRTSAHVARAFAIALGQHLTPDQMSLMFTPQFGMFIAPGCNGIRGSVTMGFIALIAGYLYKFRPRVHIAVVSAAVLLGYVFNLVRLCTLVLYYIVALRIHWFQSRAEMGDYIIGGCLFFLATLLLFHTVQRLRGPRQEDGEAQPDTTAEQSAPSATLALPAALRLAVLCLLAIFGTFHAVRAYATNRTAVPSSTQADFPRQIGSYTLTRTWNEKLATGALLYYWAEYAPAGGGAHITIGVSPSLGSHDTLICHSARGEDPLWRDQITVPMAHQAAVSFSAAFFNSGATQYLEATTLCSKGSCGEYSSNRRHFGLVFSRPHPRALFGEDRQQPVPVLLKAETIDMSQPSDAARRELLASMTTFLASADLNALTQDDRSR